MRLESNGDSCHDGEPWGYLLTDRYTKDETDSPTLAVAVAVAVAAVVVVVVAAMSVLKSRS